MHRYKDMDPYERMQIADALKVAKYKKGEFIIKQGEDGNTFYFIQSGNCSATKSEGGTHIQSERRKASTNSLPV